MKRHILLALLLLASCADKTPDMVEQPSNNDQYRADLDYCRDWAKPTRHEWAMRCESSGDLVAVAKVFDYFRADDPRDHDPVRQSMPNNTQYRLDMCMKAKGYNVAPPQNLRKVKAAEP